MTKRGSIKGQMKLSFGMIFSIILIIMFMAFAFYAIGKFLDLQNAAQIAQFSRDLQADIDKMWKGSQGSQAQEYFIPGKVKYVCFIDFQSNSRGRYSNLYEDLDQFYYEDENLFFHPPGSAEGLDANRVKNIDLNEITTSENPFCLENIKGKVKLTVEKDFGEALVRIRK